jgi:hypothetical protein
MGGISIDYQTLTLIAVMLFAMVGFMRGWIKEGLTTLVLIALVGLLYYPSLMAPVVSGFNKLMTIVKALLKMGGVGGATATATAGAQSAATGDSTYSALMWVLVVFLAISFLGGQITVGDKKLSALSRILGGLAGALNGFIAISLFKEYMLRYLQKIPLPTTTVGGASATAGIQAAAPAAGGVAISVQNLPQQPFIGSIGSTVMILGGAALLVVLLNQLLARARLGKKK